MNAEIDLNFLYGPPANTLWDKGVVFRKPERRTHATGSSVLMKTIFCHFVPPQGYVSPVVSRLFLAWESSGCQRDGREPRGSRGPDREGGSFRP